MSSDKTTLEIIAPTPEEAVARGLSDLGLPPEAVMVEVLDNGSKGVFGLGARQARVRLTVLGAPASYATTKPTPPPAAKATETTEATRRLMQEDDADLDVAIAVVSTLLEKMQIRAKVSARRIEPEENDDPAGIMVEINCDDLSILIGRRSETLNALQYISSLIIGKELGHWVHLVIDVQGYRSRRERQLRQLARRMADQAVASGRRQTLEPMPANERRMIHLELRNHPSVTTESMGDEPNRKVTVVPKK